MQNDSTPPASANQSAPFGSQPRRVSSHAVLLACVAAAGMACAWDAGAKQGASVTITQPNTGAGLPDVLKLDAVIRDFKSKGETGGHGDFQAYGNPNITTGLVEETLDSEGKPVFKTKRGMEIRKPAKTKGGKLINPSFQKTDLGDSLAEMGVVGSDQLSTAEAFNQWYRDVPRVNMTKAVPLVLKRQPGTNTYVFDSAVDEPYKSRGGFFPINDDLFGNFGTWKKNFHFTTEISTKFVFERDKGLIFTFTGDDDVWVFIDGKLVLDLGGLHPKREQSIELNRIDWLKEGKMYDFKIFHAERATNESNFRIETNLMLLPAALPPQAGLGD